MGIASTKDGWRVTNSLGSTSLLNLDPLTVPVADVNRNSETQIYLQL